VAKIKDWELLNRSDLRAPQTLRCANLAGSQVQDLKLDSDTRLNFTNIGNSDDKSDLSSSLAPNTKPRLLQLSDKQWQEWRRLGFPINAHYEPVLDKTQACIKAPCDAGVPDPSDFKVDAACKQ